MVKVIRKIKNKIIQVYHLLNNKKINKNKLKIKQYLKEINLKFYKMNLINNKINL